MTQSALSTRRGALILMLLCTVQFLDIVDGSIVNVALPSIREDLGFSQQSIQWVLSGYLVSYGGFLLLGGRAGDLLGRRRVLIAGTAVFAICSMAGGLAMNAELLVAARILQGIGAAMMAPAGLSILTTTFTEGRDRNKALGIWGAMSGLGAATGVFLGGVLSEGPGWRWVLLVNPPICVAIIAAAIILIPADSQDRDKSSFDARGAILVSSGMLIGLYALIKAPEEGRGTPQTIGELATAAVLLIAFVVNESRVADPLFPLSILRVKGIAAADATQLLAFGGFVGMFFFLTLYQQTVLGYSPIQAGSAYLPVTVVLTIAAGVTSVLIGRIGTRPIIVTGALISAVGMYLLSRIPVDGNYVADLLPGLLLMSLGLGAILVAVTAAANAGVPADKAGLAAGLLNTSLQLGSALAVAIFSALATARTKDLLASGAPMPEALTGGFSRAILASSIFLLAAAVIAFRAPNTRKASMTPGIPPAGPAPEPAPEPAV